MKNKPILFLAASVFLYSLSTIFFDIYILNSKFDDIQIENSKIVESTVEDKLRIEMRAGILENIFIYSNLLSELNDSLIPAESKPQSSLEKIENKLLMQKLYLVFIFFIAFLCLNIFISNFYEAWFSVFLTKIFLFFSSIFFGKYLLLFFIASYIKLFSSFFQATAPPLDYLTITLITFINLPFMILCIMAFRKVKKAKPIEEMNYQSLYIAGLNNEENNSKINFSTKKDESISKGFFIFRFLKSIIQNDIIRHFAIIITMGIIIGNLVYIPLFSLQKNYQTHFGYLLFAMLFILSVFYIRNYYIIGKNQRISFQGNLGVSISFLQYRFIRNTFFLFFSIVGVVIFVIFLFLILNFNSSFLKDTNLIDKTINL